MFRPHGAHGWRSSSSRKIHSLASRPRCHLPIPRSRGATVVGFPHISIQARGKKTKTTVKLSDLPQGVIHADPLSDVSGQQVQGLPKARDAEDAPQDEPAYPTVVLQARRNMARFDNCVLLTRVGGFYELYFEHAEEYGPLLNIKVATKKTNAGPVSMVIEIPLPPLASQCVSGG